MSPPPLLLALASVCSPSMTPLTACRPYRLAVTQRTELDGSFQELDAFLSYDADDDAAVEEDEHDSPSHTRLAAFTLGELRKVSPHMRFHTRPRPFRSHLARSEGTRGHVESYSTRGGGV